ncbi:IclR family transcriptional regulator [Motilibacter rhizosphaerae]|uniref:IclR family transcriptional regulator n=1 Tax=Motilibacter rhizosphaerae TaxID=598652 RepID=A0A4Q7NUP4_9ACTN|nr:IclR family transcriptional regulator [Motilibacter rhizosphaerae]RZS90887.1 IclR family transcriptional regulator [Motilibacter rhizosphaerae]
MPVRAAPAPAATAVLRILGHLARQAAPVPAASLARALGMPRSSVYRLLAVLEEDGWVIRFPETRAYGLGVAAFELSQGYLRQAPLARTGRPVLAALVDRARESAHLAVLEGRDVVYLVEERAPRRPPLVTDVGVRLPAHLTATGRAMLAALPAAQVRALFGDVRTLPLRGAKGLGTYAALRRELTAVRARGYAVEDGEVTEGLASVAVAVRDRSGWPAAALAVTYPAGVGEDGRAALVRAVEVHAQEFSRRLFGAAP